MGQTGRSDHAEQRVWNIGWTGVRALRLDGGSGRQASRPRNQAYAHTTDASFQAHVSLRNTYATACDYLTKPSAGKPQPELDQNPLFTDGHPALADIPRPAARVARMWAPRGRAAREPEEA